MDKNVSSLIEGGKDGSNSFADSVNNLSLAERSAALKTFSELANKNAAANASLPSVELEFSELGNVTGVNVRAGKQVETPWQEGWVQQFFRKVAEGHLASTAARHAEEAVANAGK